MIPPRLTSLFALLLATLSPVLTSSAESRLITEMDESVQTVGVDPHLFKMKIMATLRNFKGELLSEEEEGFFDASWVAAYEQINLLPNHKIKRVTIEEQSASGITDASLFRLRGRKETVLDLHLDVELYCEDCEAKEQSDWLQRRKLVRTRQEYRKIEKALCQNLVEGPYENLQDVECIVTDG